MTYHMHSQPFVEHHTKRERILNTRTWTWARGVTYHPWTNCTLFNDYIPKSFADSFRATSCACDTTFLCRRKKTVLGGSSKGRRPLGDTRTAVTQQGRAEGQQQHLLHCGRSRNRCIGFAGISGDGEMGSKSIRTVELEAVNRGAAAASKWTPSDAAERQHNRRKLQLLCKFPAVAQTKAAKSQNETV